MEIHTKMKKVPQFRARLIKIIWAHKTGMMNFKLKKKRLKKHWSQRILLLKKI